jgi:hypothetical protein
MREEPLNNVNEDIVLVIGSATMLSGWTTSLGLVIRVHGSYKEKKPELKKKWNKFRSVGQPTNLHIFQNPYKMTKKRQCKKYSLTKFRALERLFC